MPAGQMSRGQEKGEEKMRTFLIKKNDGDVTVISKTKTGGFRYISWRKLDKYVYFRRQYASGYPGMEFLLNPPPPITEEVTCSPVYCHYLFFPVQLKTGISVELGEDGFFDVSFLRQPIFPETEYFVTDRGAYPLQERDSDYQAKIGDAEPHNYRVEAVLDVEREVYHLKYYRDGEFRRNEIIGMTEIFSACPRVKNKKLLKLFELLEKNIDLLKRNLILSNSTGLEGTLWNMADGSVKEAVQCHCSGTNWNNTIDGLISYQTDFFFDGVSVFKVCHVCGRNEKLF